MASPERGRPQLQLELELDLITNGNALSLLDASDDLLSPSVMSKPAWRLDGNARQSRRGLLLSPAGCVSEGSSVATPAPPSDASWPTYAPGPLKVDTHCRLARDGLASLLHNQHVQAVLDDEFVAIWPGAAPRTLSKAKPLIATRPLWLCTAASDFMCWHAQMLTPLQLDMDGNRSPPRGRGAPLIHSLSSPWR